jgi:hypothetical protein
MAYGLYLILDQPKWFRGDFSSTNKLTGTIYSDIKLTRKANLSGYTITIRLTKNHRWGDYFNKTATIVSATDGTFEYAVAENEMPPPGIYNVKAELSKSGARESTLNRVELLIVEGATA